jgi:hypothetical protein
MAIVAGVSLACSSALPVFPSVANTEMSATALAAAAVSNGSPPARAIAIGEEVHGMLEGHGASEVFEVLPSSGGTLAVRVMWDSPAILELWFAGVLLAQSDKRLVVVKVPVTAGQRYRVKIGDAAAWDYDDFLVAFTLTMAIE